MLWLAGLAVAAVAAAQAEAPAALDSRSRALESYLKTYVGKDYIPEARYAVAWKDLNGDGRPEAIVHLIGPRWCGSGGCRVAVLEQTHSGFIDRGHLTISSAPIGILRSKTNGWRDLVVQAGDAFSYGPVVVPFRGPRYAGNPTMPPAHRLGGQSAVEVLIERDERGKPLED